MDVCLFHECVFVRVCEIERVEFNNYSRQLRIFANINESSAAHQRSTRDRKRNSDVVSLNERRKHDIQVSLIFTIAKSIDERIEGRIDITTRENEGNEGTGGAWWAPLCQGLRPGWPLCEKKSSFYHVVPATLDYLE